MGTAAVVLTIHLHVILHVPVDKDDLALARDSAQALLASAGIATEWQQCDALTARCEPANAPNVISVRLLPTKVTGRPACGELVRDPKRGTVALIHVLRHRELVLDVHHSPAGRAHPSLSTLEPGHVTGLAIAHEVGHALNLRHARRGVMKAWIDLDDLRALRESRLAFTPEQSARMRARMVSDLRLSISRGPPPGVLEAATAELLALGRPHGRERIVLMDAAGHVVAEAEGNPTSAGDPSIEGVLNDPHAAVSLLHNHPKGRSLSVTDVANLAKPGCRAVIAVGHDGSQFVVSRGAAFDARRLWSQGHTAFVSVHAALSNTDARHRLASHAVNLTLHDMGVIEYWFRLNDELAALARTHQRGMGAAIRRTTTRLRDMRTNPDPVSRGISSKWRPSINASRRRSRRSGSSRCSRPSSAVLREA